MKPLRILQIQTYLRSERINPRAGGKSRVALMLTRGLLEAGQKVALYPWPERIWGETLEFSASPAVPAPVFPTLALPSPARLLPDAARLLRAKFSGSDRHMLFLDLCFLEGLRLAIDRFGPDILHCHQTESDIPVLLPLTGRKPRTILTHHSGRTGSNLSVYDRIIFLSRAMQDEVCRKTGYPRERTRILYYPVSDVFLEGEVVPGSERSGLVSVGNLKDSKGVDLLLEAYRRNERLRGHTLHLCGSGQDEERYKSLVKQENLPVVFHGRLSASEIKTIVSGSLLLVNPSRMEGFSVALMESLACGTPVVGWAPQVQELQDWWRQPVGWAFDARIEGVDALAGLVAEALESPVLGDPSRRALADKARESFSMQRYGREMAGHYADLIGGG
ncbi:MAG: glycosyltransferase family 4 protein [Anaerolineales bacterium]|nr:glycosyltransferase family 4 protein [Anaerolineales bacterium]